MCTHEQQDPKGSIVTLTKKAEIKKNHDEQFVQCITLKSQACLKKKKKNNGKRQFHLNQNNNQ